MNPPPTPRDVTATIARVGLDAFLRSGCKLDFRPRTTPKVSIVMLLCNRAEVTLACLRSLAFGLNTTPFELILVDNGSTDKTGAMLDQIEGATIIRNPQNVGYPMGVNQGVAQASGEYLLLLNNDTEVLGRSIDAAVECLDTNASVGMVGGRVVLLDGTLQEAGCVIWRDGWPGQFARGWSPDDPAVMFERDVDYCSAAFMMTRRQLFVQSGGFDEVFSPGYFEDPDFSVRLRRAGWRARYLPDIVILHYENATSSSLFNVKELSRRNHRLFCARHADWLENQPPCGLLPMLHHRRADDIGLNVLVVGASSTTERTVLALESLGAMVTVAMNDAGSVRLPRTVEVVPVASRADLERLLMMRMGYYQFALCDGDPPADLRALLLSAKLNLAQREGSEFRMVA